MEMTKMFSARISKGINLHICEYIFSDFVLWYLHGRKDKTLANHVWNLDSSLCSVRLPAWKGVPSIWWWRWEASEGVMHLTPSGWPGYICSGMVWAGGRQCLGNQPFQSKTKRRGNYCMNYLTIPWKSSCNLTDGFPMPGWWNCF